MNFNANFHSVVSCLADMERFSGLLTIAVSGNMSIQKTQTRDTLENWGICHPNHDYCYGRHLYYRTNNTGIILPFWIGLDIGKTNTFVTITFERATLKALSLVNNVVNLNAVHSILPSYCTSHNCTLIERQLVQAEFGNLCGNPNPQILTNFIDEVLNCF